jgi:hypothetical protein
MGALDATGRSAKSYDKKIWRHWMQHGRKYRGTGCNIKAQDGKYGGTGCNLNPEKYSKSKLLNSKLPALFSYPLLTS